MFRKPFILFSADEGSGGGSDTQSTENESAEGTDDLASKLAALQAEAEKWKSLSRKWEDRAKSNSDAATKLAEIEKANLSETERAVQEAIARGRAEAIRENAERVAAAELRAALTGVVKDPATVIEDLNLSKYIGEGGEILTEKVSALRDKYAALAPKPSLDLGQGQGRNQSGKAPQLTREQLKSMTPAQIVEAQAKGQLDDLLSGKL